MSLFHMKQKCHPFGWHLRLSKNYRFSDNLCFDFAKHESSESSYTEIFSLLK